MLNPIEFFDSHCHFDFAVFELDRDTIWQRCKSVGVQQLMLPGVCPAQWASASLLAEQWRGIYFAVGVHPWWIKGLLAKETLQDGLGEQSLEKIRSDLRFHLSHQKCLAIGECGLDTLIDTHLTLQQQLLDVHLQLASELHLPMILHCRKAHNELIAQLKKYTLPAGGVIHAFSGSIDLAATYWRMGFYVGIGGTITYERAKKTRNAVKQLPIESLLLETDAPHMPLNGCQGQRNAPDNLPSIAQALADIRGEPLAYIAQQTTKNACLLWGIKDMGH